jgi:type VII secretion protein EccB
VATRRDQLQSYQFLMQRVISAFVMRETDPAQSPLRRGIGAAFGGIMVAVIVGAVFGVYGLLTKVGTDNWKVDGAVVVEKETGATFVYLSGVLHPTLNYTSALLAAGRAGQQAVRVSSNSLAGVPRGITVGIPNAPTSLPPANKTIGMPWTMCSGSGTDNSGRTATTVTLAAGRAPTGAQVLTSTQGLLVKDSASGSVYLVWNSHRYALHHAATVVQALFSATATPVPVGSAWLNTVPAGADIDTINFPNPGTPSPAVPDHRIGDVLAAPTGSTTSYFLVLGDGIEPITPLQKAILGGQYQVNPQPFTVAAYNGAAHSHQVPQPTGDAAPPQSPPTLAQPVGTDLVCARFDDAGKPPGITTGGAVAQLDTAVPTGSRSPTGAVLADRVLVPAGRVAVVRVLPSQDADAGAYYLVTDQGIRYAVPSETVLSVLGYDPNRAVGVPSTLVARIPAGPTLDPAAALQPTHAAATPGG